MKNLPTFDQFVNEAKTTDELRKYVKATYKKEEVNSVTFDEVLIPLADHLDIYVDRGMGDLEYSKETMAAFKKLVDLMVKDHIEAADYQ